jgi:hypothetical protein
MAPGWTHGTFCPDDRYIVENDEFYVATDPTIQDRPNPNPTLTV